MSPAESDAFLGTPSQRIPGEAQVNYLSRLASKTRNRELTEAISNHGLLLRPTCGPNSFFWRGLLTHLPGQVVRRAWTAVYVFFTAYALFATDIDSIAGDKHLALAGMPGLS